MLHAIHRHPVKSMLGERLDAGVLGARGLAGDRAWAVVDAATGLVASAKQPQPWGALLQVAARTDEPDPLDPGVELDVPGHGRVRAPSHAADRALSALVGRDVHLVPAAEAGTAIERVDPDVEALLGPAQEVRLGAPAIGGLAAAAPPGTVFDHAPLHIVAAASIEALAAAEPGADIAVERFRPNLVLDLPGGAYAENDLLGREVAVGESAVLRLLVPTPRCVVPSLAFGSHGQDREVLRAVARRNRPPLGERGPRPCLGAYAEVVSPGPVRVGDAVSLR